MEMRLGQQSMLMKWTAKFWVWIITIFLSGWHQGNQNSRWKVGWFVLTSSRTFKVPHGCLKPEIIIWNISSEDAYAPYHIAQDSVESKDALQFSRYEKSTYTKLKLICFEDELCTTLLTMMVDINLTDVKSITEVSRNGFSSIEIFNHWLKTYWNVIR